jgi:hypothetical protein
MHVVLSKCGFQRRPGSAILSLAPWWWEAQPSPLHGEPTTMIIIGIILGFVGLAYFCWLLFALAVHALPLFAAVAVGLATYHSGSGPIGAIIVGAIAGSATVLAGQIAFMALRSPLIRAAIAFLFALPAAVAGYHAALGLAHIAVPAEGWQQAIAVGGAIIVAATAWARMALSAPPGAGQGIAAGLTSPDPLTSPARRGSASAVRDFNGC